MKPIRGGLLSAIGAVLLLGLTCLPLAGASVRADFNGDGRSDLAIGAPRESLGPSGIQHGAVHVLYGARQRLGLAGNLYLTANTAGILGGGARAGDQFGGALAAGDFDVTATPTSRSGSHRGGFGAFTSSTTPARSTSSTAARAD